MSLQKKSNTEQQWKITFNEKMLDLQKHLITEICCYILTDKKGTTVS